MRDLDIEKTAAGLKSQTPIVAAEWRAIRSLALIYAARMLGIFLLLPVLSLYVQSLEPSVSALLIGFSMGAYGLTQAIFQVPAGIWSDRYGRKRVIAIGLVLYAAGSLMGMGARSVWAVISARLIQGAGAISGPVTALLADLTRQAVRTRAMAVIGISIGATFLLSLLVAPLLAAHIGVPGIFALMAALALVSLWVLWRVVPDPELGPSTVRMPLKSAFLPRLLPFYSGICMLNMVLVATFTVVPGLLRDGHHVAVADHWRWYLGVFALSLLPTVGLVWLAERGWSRLAFGLSALSLAGALASLAYLGGQRVALVLSLTAFFAGFNFLEARLPARLSQLAPLQVRGAALSVFATAQFLGSFMGGVGAGLLLHVGGAAAVLWTMALMSVAWSMVSGWQPAEAGW